MSLVVSLTRINDLWKDGTQRMFRDFTDPGVRTSGRGGK